jgi:hypothetical protein
MLKKIPFSLGAPVPSVRSLQKPCLYERVEKRGASIRIDTGQPGSLRARDQRPWHLREDAAQPIEFVAGSHGRHPHGFGAI